MKLTAKSDNQQKGFFRYAFQMDWNDPSPYDLIINTGAHFNRLLT